MVDQEPREPDPETPPQESPSSTYLTARRSNVGERLVEMGIFSVATLSIVFIFLILFFVFREASPIFFGESKDKVVSNAIIPKEYLLPGDSLPETSSSDASEVYNPGAENPSASGDTSVSNSPTEKDTSQASAQPNAANESDVYNPSTGAPPETEQDTATASSGATAGTTDTTKIRGGGIVEAGYPVLERESPVNLSYIFFDNWQPNSEHPRYGIYPIVIGTLKSTFIAILLATPLAILAAIFTAFFAPKRLRNFLKPTLELLAGFPSVVVGFICLMTVATIVQDVFGTESRLNAVVGGIGLALAVFPIIYTITDDALRSVPSSLREAALAIGASEWQTAYQIMLPAATPGIIAAVLLGIGRAFGETMIALMAMGNANTMGWNFFDPVRTFAATIGAEMGEVQHGAPHYQLLFLLGVILFGFSFGLNLIAEFWVKERLIKKFRGNE
jgi:phosphate transport system permease protein